MNDYCTMIPKIIHYCWFGGKEMPELEQKCVATWHEYMPDWQYMQWDESNFDIANAPLYVRQAYEAKKFAFVSDYVRLWALEQYGGLYMDVDFEVYRPFDDLMDAYPAFAGYEGCKRRPVMQGVIASKPHGAWVKDMLATYESRVFIKPDGSLDLTPNTAYFTDRLEAQGFTADGVEKDLFVEVSHDSSIKLTTYNIQHSTMYLHVFPVHYFCPVLTTGENLRTDDTYCEHKGESSWAEKGRWKARLLSCFSPETKTMLIKLKRRILG